MISYILTDHPDVRVIGLDGAFLVAERHGYSWKVAANGPTGPEGAWIDSDISRLMRTLYKEYRAGHIETFSTPEEAIINTAATKLC